MWFGRHKMCRFPPNSAGMGLAKHPGVQFDPAIRKIVDALRASGIETFESCQGGAGHAFAEPTVRFHGGRDEGFRALACALQQGLPVNELRRYWQVVDGEPRGPYWEMTFHEPAVVAEFDGRRGLRAAERRAG